MLPNISNASTLTTSSSRCEILKALVDWIQIDQFAVGRKDRKTGQILYNWTTFFPTLMGWDNRIKQYAYATANPTPAFRTVRYNIQPIIANLNSGIHANIIAGMQSTILWGGLRLRHYSTNWAIPVITYAQTRGDGQVPPMNSGWTKVAALYSMGNSNMLDQSIWDSRMSTSIIYRLDKLGISHPVWNNIVTKLNLRNSYLVMSGRGGTRNARRYNNVIPNQQQATTWDAHFWGSQIVHEMVNILNNPAFGYPKMPEYDNVSKTIVLKDWDVWGVGMVLFMDGY